MSIKNAIPLIFCAMALIACAGKSVNDNPLRTHNAVISVSAKQESIIKLLAFSDNFSNLTLEAQKKVFAETNQALTENKNDLTQRIQLAIMLSIPSSRLRDLGKAQNLLQELLQENTLTAPESALISLLYEYTVDNIKQSQKNKDDAAKLELIQQKYENLQQKNTALEQKLNDLKDIEKTMNERDTKSTGKQGSKP
ncbi:MAG: hypothetical protein CVU27_00745 [Betaproteobacteria bacterium HGW-Betaproteobacteria-20]|nr:MAG: hypothetical protein CVU27_00745 [Betaproteobacteria bacterium HGW-Betaproteobacteria-20]